MSPHKDEPSTDIIPLLPRCTDAPALTVKNYYAFLQLGRSSHDTSDVINANISDGGDGNEV